MNRTEWLESLKPGDKVLLEGDGYRGIRTVERLTPTGRVILKGRPDQFINGAHRIDDWHSDTIHKLTKEAKDKIHRSIKIQKIEKYNWKHDDVNKIDAVYDILFGDTK